jgi:putative restriction endonuclease
MPAFSERKFWWVNQNQTFDHEYQGGYLWSPKEKANGARNQFYENMRVVAPGDVIFSFREIRIAAIGIAKSYGYESPKPPEFGDAGPNWGRIGWRVDVQYVTPKNLVRPKDHMHILARLLPDRYSPLQPNGNGLQSVYLAALPDGFAKVLAGLIGPEAQQLMEVAPEASIVKGAAAKGIEEWEEHLQKEIRSNPAIPETEKVALIKARRGQGIFKENVMVVEKACRITQVDNPVHLIGSHIKPWRDCSNAERLDGENGLLLTPSIDHLFDRGFISFEGTGEILVSPRADEVSLQRMGIRVGERVNVGSFSRQQKHFLEFHRDKVFLQARKAQ